MDDPFLVRMLHRGAQLVEQFQTVTQLHAAGIAEGCDRDAFDELITK